MANIRLEIPPWQKYTCQSTGLCCRRGLDISGFPADKERLSRIDWTQKNPRLAEGTLFVEKSKGFRLATDKDGACRFLNPDNLCLMHKEIGYSQKLLACKMFPFHFVHSAGRVHVSLLFSCPTVIDNIGQPLTEQVPHIRKHLAELDAIIPPPATKEETSLDGRQAVRFRDVRFLEETLIKILQTAKLPFVRRVLWAGDILDRLEGTDEEQLSPKNFHPTLCHHRDRAQDNAENSGLKKIPLGLFERALLRQLQGICTAMAETGMASTDGSTRRAARYKRIGAAYRYFLGAGILPENKKRWHLDLGVSREPFPATPTFAAVFKVRSVSLPTASEELLGRYLATRFWGRTYFGGEFWGLSVLHGARALLSLAAIVVWHAKVFAAGEGRGAVTHEDIRGAVLLTDHAYGHLSNLNAGFTRKALAIVNRQEWAQRALLYTML